MKEKNKKKKEKTKEGKTKKRKRKKRNLFFDDSMDQHSFQRSTVSPNLPKLLRIWIFYMKIMEYISILLAFRF